MSVYTPVDNNDVESLSRLYPLGRVRQLEGIEAGVQNTNYFLYAQTGDYVLTVFETIDHRQVERSMRFMHYLSLHDVPSSDPLVSINGNYVETLHNKPVAIVKRVVGASSEKASDDQLQSLAQAVATWHIAVQHYDERWDTRFDGIWQRDTAQLVLPQLESGQRELLTRQLQNSRQISCESLPCGIIHSDLFRDNALFEGSKVTAIIDLYDIYYGSFIYDIAVIINDWCQDDAGLVNLSRARQFIRYYQQQRVLNDDEIRLLPMMLKAAALRFWLSRLHALMYPKSGSLALCKDPKEFERLLRFWLATCENPALS